MDHTGKEVSPRTRRVCLLKFCQERFCLLLFSGDQKAKAVEDASDRVFPLLGDLFPFIELDKQVMIAAAEGLLQRIPPLLVV